MDIPGEARAAIDALYDHVQPYLQHNQRLMVSCAQEGAEAAAPHIARAAQVQILREKSRELQSRSFGESQLVARGMELSALALADWADELEQS